MFAIKEYEYLFSEPCTGEETLRDTKVGRYRVKTIRSGTVLELEIYPIWETRSEMRKARGRITPEEQREVNRRNAVKKFQRRANANFGANDLAVTLTYGGIVSVEQARRDIVNYIKRIKRYRTKQGLPDVKYMYVIESNEDEETSIPRYHMRSDGTVEKQARRETKRKEPFPRVHHHMILSGMDRDVVEQLWTKGYANARRLQPNEDGIIALALYMLKDPQGKKRWRCSKNLVDPVVTTADRKVSKRQAERIATAADTQGKEIFEKFHPDYRLAKIQVKRSDRVSGVYIYARMFKKQISDSRTPKTRPHAHAYAHGREETIIRNRRHDE